MIVRSIVRCLTILTLAASVCLGGPRTYDFQKRALSNGLTVITLEDHSCPIVAVQVWYHVGSKDEDPQRQGFAHMFEHMMFRGTDRLGCEEHFEHVHRTGGSCNAYTSFDNTTYVNEVPSNQLELALWLEAERMASLKIDDESFYTERSVVEEERRERSLNTPYGTVPEKLLPVIFEKHPYRWTPIGRIPHLRAATIDELQAFWDRYYTPSNATLVIVGDVTHEDAQRLAEKYFGWMPQCPVPPRVTIQEPPQTAPRSVTIKEKKGPVPIVGLAYRGVGVDHQDALAVEMLMSILGGGESSRLYKDIVKERELAQYAVAGSISFEDDGLLGAAAVLMPWADQQNVLDAIREHIKRLKADGVTGRELEKVRNQYLRSDVTNALTIGRKAGLLGEYEVIEGGAEKANQRLAEIRAVTVDDLKRVADVYLVKERETTAIVKPAFGSMISSFLGFGKKDIDEGAEPISKPEVNRVATRGGCRAELKRPEWYPEKPPTRDLLAAMPKVEHQKRTLDNGLEVVVVPNREVPFVTVMLGCLNGGWTEPKPGGASMAASMITKGSANHTAAEMAEELEFNAVSLSGRASMDAATVSASCVKDKFALAVKLMAEVVRTPAFPTSELEVLRKQELLGLMVQARMPGYVADREMRQRLFGEHPYARTSTGEPADVQAITTSDLKDWWGAFIRPEKSTLYIAGDVQPDEALAVAKTYFGDWKNDAPESATEVTTIPKPAKTHIYLLDRPGSVQSEIRVGHIGITRDDERYFRTRVLSQIFGGAFNSRLNEAIRVEKGLTYGASGGFTTGRFAGRFYASTSTKTPSTAEAIQVILDEIDRLHTTTPEPDEVDMAKSYLVGSFAGDRETPQSTVGDLWLIKYDALPDDYFNRYLTGVRETTPENVLADARHLIHRDDLVIVVVGHAEHLKADLEKIAPVTVVSAVEEPATPPDPTPEREDTETGSS